MTKDNYFRQLCDSVAKESRCFSRQIGAVLTTKDDVIISVGSNDPPSCLPDCSKRPMLDPVLNRLLKDKGLLPSSIQNHHICPRKVLEIPSGKQLELCTAVHAERNCIVNASYTGTSTAHTKLYMNESVPCPHCMIELINAGVEELILLNSSCYDESSIYIFNECNDLTIRLFNSEIIIKTLDY